MRHYCRSMTKFSRLMQPSTKAHMNALEMTVRERRIFCALVVPHHGTLVAVAGTAAAAAATAVMVSLTVGEPDCWLDVTLITIHMNVRRWCIIIMYNVWGVNFSVFLFHSNQLCCHWDTHERPYSYAVKTKLIIVQNCIVCEAKWSLALLCVHSLSFTFIQNVCQMGKISELRTIVFFHSLDYDARACVCVCENVAEDHIACERIHSLVLTRSIYQATA